MFRGGYVWRSGYNRVYSLHGLQAGCVVNDLALPMSFVGLPSWHVIRWIVEHRNTFIVFGLRWFALSLLFAVLWSIWMTFFGHPRDDD